MELLYWCHSHNTWQLVFCLCVSCGCWWRPVDPTSFCSIWALSLGRFNHILLLAISLKDLCLLKDIVYYLSWAYDLDSFNKWYAFISFGPVVFSGIAQVSYFMLHPLKLQSTVVFFPSMITVSIDEPTILHGVFTNLQGWFRFTLTIFTRYVM